MKADSVLLLNASDIHHHLQVARVTDLNIVILDSISSTIDWIKQTLSEGVINKATPTLCLAEHQSAGRGQQNRAWYAPANHNIYLSLYWTFPYPLKHFAGFSLWLGLVTVEALSEYPLTEVSLKWPNDVYCRGRKIGGILVESLGYSVGSSHTAWIISLGLNVNMTGNDDTANRSIHQPWTSLRIETGQECDRNRLIAAWLIQFTEKMPLFLEQGWQAFLPQWQRYDYLFGKSVTVHQKDTMILGQALGVDTQGRLIVKTAGGVTAQHSGSIQVI